MRRRRKSLRGSSPWGGIVLEDLSLIDTITDSSLDCNQISRALETIRLEELLREIRAELVLQGCIKGVKI